MTRTSVCVMRPAFVSILKALKPLASKRNLRPILSSVRIRWDEHGGVSFAATDLETSLVVGEHGTPVASAVLPLERLLALATTSKAEHVTIEDLGDRKFKVTVGDSGTTMMGEDPEEYPAVQNALFKSRATIEVTAKTLKELLLPRFAVAQERSRFAFNGMRFQTEGLVLCAIATDGKRMAVRKKTMVHHEGDQIGHIVPRKSLDVLATWMKNEGDDSVIRLHASEKHFLFETEGWALCSTLVDGAFPKYESVIPKDAIGSVTFNRKAMIEALTKAKATTNDENRSVKLSPDGYETLVVSSRAMDVGETFVRLDVAWGGSFVECAFNPDFVIEGLKVMSEERLTMELSSKDTPALIRSNALTYVVMPVTQRVGSEPAPVKMKPVIGTKAS
jgi:DNA polymerase III subunit beta